MAAAAAEPPAPPDFILLGPTGFLGAAIGRALAEAGCKVVESRLRLQDRMGLEKLLDETRPSLGVICAAGERGRPNISWCDDHPVETVDANIIGQLNVAAACHARGLHVTLLGTGAMYVPDATYPERLFTEEDPSNIPAPGTYVALRVKLEELLRYFDNALILRVVYPVSSDLDRRGLLGKLARFETVDSVVTSVTVLEDLCPLIPELVRRRVTGPLNFVNPGTLSYADVVAELGTLAPPGWRGPRISAAARRPAAPLDASRLLAEAGAAGLPDASASVYRILLGLRHEDFAGLPAAAEAAAAAAPAPPPSSTL